MSRLPFAGKPEIIRSSQKDDYHSGTISSLLHNIFKGVFGLQSLSKWKQELEMISHLLYYAVTTYSGYQTLGEEYVNIVQVDASKMKLASKPRRCVMILLQVVGPYLLLKGLNLVQQKLLASRTLEPQLRNFLAIKLLPFVEKLITWLNRSHLAYFYITGVFYHVSKRLTSTRYILIRKFLENDTFSNRYKIMGILSLCQLLYSLKQIVSDLKADFHSVLLVKAKFQSKLSKTSSEDEHAKVKGPEETFRCILCLESIKHPTATSCGHVFCWYCIHGWCQTKQECPLCRQPILPSRLIYLYFFKP